MERNTRYLAKDYENCGAPFGNHACILPTGHDGPCKCSKWCAEGHDKVDYDILIAGVGHTERKTDEAICIHCHHWIEEHSDDGCDAGECPCSGFQGGGPARDC